MKIKLYVYNPYPAVGGSDKTLARFLDSIDKNKFEIVLLSLKDNINSFTKIKLIKLNSFSTFFSFFKIRKIILNDNSKNIIFFSMQYFVNIWSIIFLKNINNTKIFIYEINHPSELDFYFSFVEFFKKKILKYLVIKLYKRADLICGNSNELSRDLSKMINKKVLTIYNPCFFKIIKVKRKIPTKLIKVLNISRFEMKAGYIIILHVLGKYNFNTNNIYLDEDICHIILHCKQAVQLFNKMKHYMYYHIQFNKFTLSIFKIIK